MMRLIWQTLVLSSFIFGSGQASACTNCPVYCTDIIPCPVTPYVPPLVCDPKIEIYQIRGRFDYFTELMRTYKECELTHDDFKFVLATGYEPIAVQSQSSQQTLKILVRSMSGDVTVTTSTIAHQLDKPDRQAIIRGCFANPWLFLAEQVDFDFEAAAREHRSGRNSSH